MANHILSLEAPDTLNTKILRIVDTSIYASTIPVECALLSVTAPGFSYSVEFTDSEIPQGFNRILTACDLELQTQNCGTAFSDLPDGIYVIRYSVSPNDVVYVEYNHLRLASILNCYNKILCELDIAGCDPDADKTKKLEVLGQVRMYLDAAKAKVEICHEPAKGMELYTYAQKLLSKFNCTSCY